jgi:hypothetical protein
MEKKTVKTKKPVKADPFAELALDEPVAAPEAPITAAKKAAAKKPRKTAAKKVTAAKAAPADAFAELAPATSPVKKPRAKKAVVTAEATETKPVKAKRSVKTAAAAATKTKRVTKEKITPEVVVEPSVKDVETEISPVFKALADVSLPELERENRARLMLQSPTMLYFYWSVRENPYKALHQAFGSDIGSYTLVLKLVDLGDETEKIYPAEVEGNWWFDVEPDRTYRAEIGFYAPNRPYFRIIYSNSIETPRRSPSPHPASEARWTVSATKFAEVLDVSGFRRDAIDVAIAGDTPEESLDASHNAFAHFIGVREPLTRGIGDADLRHALLAVAGGAALEDMRHQVSERLFGVLQANADRLTTDNARAALDEYFDVDEEWTAGPQPVFGASLINFPRVVKKAKALRPVSS